jgi:hypothetical protein
VLLIRGNHIQFLTYNGEIPTEFLSMVGAVFARLAQNEASEEAGNGGSGAGFVVVGGGGAATV